MNWFNRHREQYVPSEDYLELYPCHWEEMRLCGQSPLPKVDGEVWLLASKDQKTLPSDILDQLEKKLASQFYFLRTFERAMKDVNEAWLKRVFPAVVYSPIYKGLLTGAYFEDRLVHAFDLFDFGFYEGYMLLRYDGKARKWYGARLVSYSTKDIIDSVYACAAKLPERTAFRKRIAVGKVRPKRKVEEIDECFEFSDNTDFSVERKRKDKTVKVPEVRFSIRTDWDLADRLRFRDGAFEDYEEKLEENLHYLLMNDYPIALIEAMIDRNLRLSRIKVDSYYRIVLPNYYGKDWDGVVELDPLPKTILVFFLRHAGTRYQHYQLKDYEEEFYGIYNWFTNTGSEHEATIRNRIHKLVTENKYFSMLVNDIKQAFLVHLEDRVAQQYYVKKNKSGYGVSLSPDLITCP